MCRRVRELGAERPFLLATGMGTGEVPDPEEAEWCVVEARAPDVVTEIRPAPAGPPVAPLAVAAFALADERFGTGIGRLEPARAVR